MVFLHPNGFTHGERLTDHYFINVIGMPLDSTVAVAHLVFDGVLERFPRLKIVVAHGGGYISHYPGRMDHVWGARADPAPCSRRKPSWSLGKLYFDTIVFDRAQLQHLVDLLGRRAHGGRHRLSLRHGVVRSARLRRRLPPRARRPGEDPRPQRGPAAQAPAAARSALADPRYFSYYRAHDLRLCSHARPRPAGLGRRHRPGAHRVHPHPEQVAVFDAEWAEHGHMDRAVALMTDWAPHVADRGPDGRGRPPRGPHAAHLHGDARATAATTVLLYGHLDKQPEMTGWARRARAVEAGAPRATGSTAAAAPTTATRSSRRSPRIGRCRRQGIPHARCVVLIEACEESGSPDLPAYIEHARRRASARRPSSSASTRAAATTTSCGRPRRCAACRRHAHGGGAERGRPLRRRRAASCPSSFRIAAPAARSRSRTTRTGEILLARAATWRSRPARLAQAQRGGRGARRDDLRQVPAGAGHAAR